VFVDQAGLPPDFSATAAVTDDRALVTVTGEVDMSTADAMFRAATKDDAAAATLDLRGVTFFDSAAIHALLQLPSSTATGFRCCPRRRCAGCWTSPAWHASPGWPHGSG
jgi:hypothetical protein